MMKRIILLLAAFVVAGCCSTKTMVESDQENFTFSDSNFNWDDQQNWTFLDSTLNWGANIYFQYACTDSIPFIISFYADISKNYESKSDPQIVQTLLELSDGVIEIQEPGKELTGYDTTLITFYNDYAKLKKEGETTVRAHIFPDTTSDSVKTFQQKIKIKRRGSNLFIEDPSAKNDSLISFEDQAINSLINKIKTDSVYDSWTSIECLQFYTTDITEDYVAVDIRQKHGEGCSGDSTFSPRVDSFKVYKSGHEVLWYNLTEDTYEQYSVFLKYRKSHK